MMIAHNVLLAQCATGIWYDFSKVMDVIMKMFRGGLINAENNKKDVDLAAPSYQRK